VAPPDVPADHLQALRRAFDATLKDPKYLTESKRARLAVDLVTGEAMIEMIQRSYAMPKAPIARTAAVYWLVRAAGFCDGQAMSGYAD
jgi:hypothetical protein